MRIRMQPYGDGWEFDVTTETGTARFRTNMRGEGLWRYRASSSCWYMDGSPFFEWVQELGTCQFRLPSKRSAAYGRIRREFGGV